MRYTEPNQPGSEEMPVREATEEKLRKEIEDLKRQLQEQKGLVHGGLKQSALPKPWHPSAITIWSLFLGALCVSSYCSQLALSLAFRDRGGLRCFGPCRHTIVASDAR